ncbi:EF-P lysine aminoacylase EpmA [Zavarzinia sp. CC-PAN008]|uniref:EF-P lysine aminoacylase EpmA n=1 Tax=Zavarzinia sp. CC-PAN008 TaxID=3243332 RepID=UPI003F7470B9
MTVPSWQRARYAARRPNLVARARILKAIRAWFEAQDFIEVQTPAIQVSPGLETHLQAFSTVLEAPDGERFVRYLHTSPEFAMKKLLAAGEERIFQMSAVYRNCERSATHHPEFTMLEWYRAGGTTDDLIADCEGLVAAAAAAAGNAPLRWKGRSAKAGAPFEQLSVAEAFRRHAGIDLMATAEDPARLAAAAQAIGVRTAPDDRWDDLFFRIFMERIEPAIGSPRPTIVRDWPIAMAALARAKPGAPHLADRFELYVAGLEIANAFGELTDVAEQRRRFMADQDLKERLYGNRYPVDEDFLAALADMPPSAGIALGIDRLVMLVTGAEAIDDVLWVPVA